MGVELGSSSENRGIRLFKTAEHMESVDNIRQWESRAEGSSKSTAPEMAASGESPGGIPERGIKHDPDNAGKCRVAAPAEAAEWLSRCVPPIGKLNLEDLRISS